MMMLLTSDSTILPNAAPMITPTARSTTFPLKANALNSPNSDLACFAGTYALRSTVTPPRADRGLRVPLVALDQCLLRPHGGLRPRRAAAQAGLESGRARFGRAEHGSSTTSGTRHPARGTGL